MCQLAMSGSGRRHLDQPTGVSRCSSPIDLSAASASQYTTTGGSPRATAPRRKKRFAMSDWMRSVNVEPHVPTRWSARASRPRSAAAVSSASTPCSTNCPGCDALLRSTLCSAHSLPSARSSAANVARRSLASNTSQRRPRAMSRIARAKSSTFSWPCWHDVRWRICAAMVTTCPRPSAARRCFSAASARASAGRSSLKRKKSAKMRP
mmetsp:Transcript_13290/g.43349  ORF Transcript_13290/g.43349 Transcript_13290/m.43349 type:complete len:208 (-) Transcript_13290:35-658(-)